MVTIPGNKTLELKNNSDGDKSLIPTPGIGVELSIF